MAVDMLIHVSPSTMGGTPGNQKKVVDLKSCACRITKEKRHLNLVTRSARWISFILTRTQALFQQLKLNFKKVPKNDKTQLLLKPFSFRNMIIAKYTVSIIISFFSIINITTVLRIKMAVCSV